MNPRELKMHFLELSPPRLRIVRNNSDFHVQIQHHQQTELLTMPSGEQLRFANIEEAHATLQMMGLQLV